MSLFTPVCVVFIHGLFSSAKAWAPMARLVEADPELDGLVTVDCFEYGSPLMRLRPDRRIAEMDDLADRLRTRLLTELRDAGPLILVTHSQGGLVVQRFLDRMIRAGRGRELARIRHILMYACPNTGSEFFLSLRKAAFMWRHPQERQLRPQLRAVMEPQATVLRAILNARGCDAAQCRIPITTCAGMSDNIVPPTSANWVFPEPEVVDGDHRSVIRPASRNAASYQVLRRVIAAASVPEGTGPGEVSISPDEAFAERHAGVSVAAPYGKRDARLLGRRELLLSIQRASQERRVHVLAGLGGSGKSRLALELAHNAQEEGKQVWWVMVNRVNSSMREVANQLGVPENQADVAWRGGGSATDLVWRYLNDKSDRWVLIFDNADDPAELGALNSPVSDGTGWLRSPATPHGQVIVTTRDRNPATWGTWSFMHHVPPLTHDDGAEMLLELTERKGGSFKQARELSAELGGLPLALRAAADHIMSVRNARVWQGEASIRDFEDFRRVVKERFESPPGAASPLSEILGSEITRGVFEISLDRLRHKGLPQAGPLLKLFACLSIAPIPYHLLLDDTVLAASPLFTEFTASQRLTVLEELANLGLVDTAVLGRIADPNVAHVLTLHPAVHGVLRDDSDVRERRAEYYALSIRMLLSATTGVDPDYSESWVIWDVIAPHSVEITRAALLGGMGPGDRQVTALALRLARLTIRYLIVTGLATPARDLVEPMVAGCEGFGFSTEDEEILDLRHEAGRIALERGDPVAAEEELRAVIAGRERVLGENHPDTLASRHKLAKAILEQSRWDEAEPLLRSIVEAERYVRGPDHPDTLVVRHSLARAILALDRPDETEAMVRDILEIRSRIASPTTPETLYARNTLARSLLLQGSATPAEEVTLSALGDATERPDSPPVLSLRHTLAEVRLLQGRIDEAVTCLERLVGDRRRVLGPNHPDTKRTEDALRSTREAQAHPLTPNPEDRN